MSVRRLHSAGYDQVDELIQGLACCGFALGPGTRILDFGCGDGAFVYRLRDRGFDANGFDIHNRVTLRKPDDARLFQFSPADTDDTSVMTASNFNIPFPSGTFDFVYSNQVFEHLIDIDRALHEIARVMKPGALALNIYPSREALLEPHMFVPLGGVINTWWWYYLWAWVGVANQHQIGKSVRERADQNYRYSRTGVAHRTRKQMIAHVANYFTHAWFAEDLYYQSQRKAAAFRQAFVRPGRLRKLAALGPLNVLMMLART